MSALLAELCARPLTEHYVALFVDGVHVGDQTIIVSLGVTLAGDKHVLGLWPGSTENTEVCRSAFSDLADHGLTAEQGLLVVIDGSQALAAAAAATWNGRAVIQRCQAHKARNYQEKLPENKAPRILARVRRAWSQRDAVRAERRLRQIAGELEHQGHADAAGSLREGLTETLTCVRLGLPPALCTSLETTNAIESVFSRHENLAHRVKRWRDGQALRWVATSLTLAEQSFDRLPAAEHLPALAEALARHVARQTEGDGLSDLGATG